MPSLISPRHSMAKPPAIIVPNTRTSSSIPPSRIRALYKRIRSSVKPNKVISSSSSAALSDYVIIEPRTSQEQGFPTQFSGSSYSLSVAPTTALPSNSPKANPGWLSPSEFAGSDLDTLASGDARPLGHNTEPTDASSRTATSEASLFAVTYATTHPENFKEAPWWKTSPASSLTAIDVETYIKGANKDGLNNVSHEITLSSSSLIVSNNEVDAKDATQLKSNDAEDDVALGRIVHSFSKASGLAGDTDNSTDEEDDHDTDLQLRQGSSPARKANEAMMAAMCAEIDDLLNHEESVQDISVELSRGSSPVRRANDAVVAAMIDDLDTFMGELTATNEASLSTFEIFELVSVEPVTVVGLVDADTINHINDNQADCSQSAFVNVYLHWPALTNVLHLRVHMNATLDQFSTTIHNYFDYMGSCIIHLGSADNGIVMATSRLFEFWLAHASDKSVMEAWVLDDEDEAVSLVAHTEGSNGGNHVNLPRSPTWVLFQEQDLDIDQHAKAAAPVESQDEEDEDSSSWDFAMTRQEVQQDLAALVPLGDAALWKSLKSKAGAGAKLAKQILAL